MNNLGDQIRQQRIAKGLSVEELSSKTMLSVAIINDIENNAFHLYEGDETYVKMYLKKIAKALDLDLSELNDKYFEITEEMRQDKLEKEAEQLKKNQENIKKKKDFQFERPNYSKGQGVYQEKSHKKILRGGIVLVIIALIVSVTYFGIRLTKENNSNSSYTNNTNSTSGNVSNKNKTQKKETKEKEETKEEVTFNHIGTNQYAIVLPENTDKFTFKMEFTDRCWSAFYYNGSIYNELERKTYQKGESVTVTFNVSEFKKFRISNGRGQCAKYYINDTEIKLEETSVKRLTLTLAS